VTLPVVTVNLQKPTDGSDSAFGEAIAVQALVSDISRTARVEFYDGSTKIETQFFSPYSFDWVPQTAGAHTLRARVRDSDGNSRYSKSVEISVGVPAASEVVLEDPLDGESFEIGQSVLMRASVGSSTIGVERVEFYREATKLGEDRTSPYSFDWKSDVVGAFDLIARAITVSGTQSVSDPVSISVTEKALVVILATPVSGQAFPLGESVTLLASTSDVSRTVRVEFFLGEVKLGEQSSAPYSFEWKPSESGSQSLFARAIDREGASHDSEWTEVSVEGAPAGAVVITEPVDGATIEFGQTVDVIVEVDLPEGSVERVDLWVGKEHQGTQWAAPYEFSWKPEDTGNHTLRARVQTFAGRRYTPENVSLNVQYPTLVVNLLEPSSGASIPAGQGVHIEATVNWPEFVSRVEFLVDGEVLADDFEIPFAYEWMESTVGTHEVVVGAIDLDDRVALSATASVTIDEAPVTVVLLSPANAGLYEVGEEISIEAETSDPARTARVEFLVDGEVVGQVTDAPYLATWTIDAAGTHEIQVRVIDLDGSGALSKEALVNVRPPMPLEAGEYRGLFLEGVGNAVTGAFVLHVSEQGEIVILGFDERTGVGFVSIGLNLTSDGRFEVKGIGGSGPIVLAGMVSPETVEGQIDALGRTFYGERNAFGGESSFYRLAGIETMDTEVFLVTGPDLRAFVGVKGGGLFLGRQESLVRDRSGLFMQSESLGLDVALDTEEGIARGFLKRGGDTIWLSGLRHDVPAQSRLENLSTRGTLNSGGDRMIVGFVTQGEGVKQVLVRGVGPGLAFFGVASTMKDPVVELQDQAVKIAENNNWNSSQEGERIQEVSGMVGAFPLAPESTDAALLIGVSPGVYSALIRDGLDLGGNALVEIYDTDEAYPVFSQLSNLSTRGSVGAGKNLIGGFVISGNEPKRVLIRGIGPTLSGFGVSDALPSARLVLSQLMDGDWITVGDNLGWSAHQEVDLIEETAAEVGAFPLNAGSLDSALLIWLEPGVYTFIVQPGSPGHSGTALVEVYQVD